MINLIDSSKSSMFSFIRISCRMVSVTSISLILMVNLHVCMCQIVKSVPVKYYTGMHIKESPILNPYEHLEKSRKNLNSISWEWLAA